MVNGVALIFFCCVSTIHLSFTICMHLCDILTTACMSEISTFINIHPPKYKFNIFQSQFYLHIYNSTFINPSMLEPIILGEWHGHPEQVTSQSQR